VIAGAVAIVAGQLSLGPTVAPAGTVSLRPDAEFMGWAVSFDAAPGERNQLEIRDVGNPATGAQLRSWQVSDRGAPLTPGEHCTAIDEHTAHCGSAVFGPLVFGAHVALGDQDDSLTVTSPIPGAAPYTGLLVTAEGGAGNDRLYGGANRDDLRGGGGAR
jgi:Ca2+-binding RTX toxin-like protein